MASWLCQALLFQRLRRAIIEISRDRKSPELKDQDRLDFPLGVPSGVDWSGAIATGCKETGRQSPKR